MPSSEATAADDAIIVGLGANLPSQFGEPLQTLIAALSSLDAHGVHILRRSRWYRSAPVPATDQPCFINAVAVVHTALAPEPLLLVLHRIEADFGRQRSIRNEPRVLDLDLLCYGRTVRRRRAPRLPHPRLHERAFVLLPLRDVVPGWTDPESGASLADLIAGLAPDQSIAPLDDPPG
ncbi:MAG: 2-amino-4-hydroxy-6-hydroxymethyldihydropteridine diphosphokinase [Alphaproteobacteria bacterium]|nr:2-amino-4-hydroxy-6-hydroxymethyldihydropteridine diphosphokinase [Alphaproteobacteria bacterium]